MSQSIPTSSYLHCTTKDIQQFVLRKHKYMRVVDQFNEDEVVPPHLVFQFFRKLKDVKKLKTFNLKWSHISKEHMRPEIVSSIFKRHCKTIQKYDVLVLDPIVPHHYKNLGVPLKNVKTASIDSNKGLRKLNALKNVENLRVDLRSDKTDYRLLYQVLYRLPCLEMLSVTCLPKFLNETLAVLNALTEAKKQTVKFEILVGGQQEHSDIPPLDTKLREKITHISFQHVSPNMLLSNLFRKKPFVFSCLKVLKLEFNNIGAKATSYLRYLRDISHLEKLTLILRQCTDKEVVGGLIKGLRLPTSLETLELDMPLHLKSLLTKTKRLLTKSVMEKGRQYPWRYRNIFEEEEAFGPLFQNFAEMASLKTIVFDFHMLENFNPHYTNFLVSILARLSNLSFLEIQVLDHRPDSFKDTYQGFVDLAPFFKVCSAMPKIEQIEILMPSLLFDGAELNFTANNLKSLTIGVDEKEESRPIRFTNISKSVEKILKTLAKSSPNLTNLTLDFAEEIAQDKLIRRFWMIQRFTCLEALGARFFVGECDEETPKEIGKVLKSLTRLNMLLLKFLETDKNIYGIQNYIKYHKSLRNMMIQFNNTAWMDNDCLIDPLRIQIKETTNGMEEENEDNNDNDSDDENENENPNQNQNNGQNMLEQSVDEIAL